MNNLELVFKTWAFYHIFLLFQSFIFLFCFVSHALEIKIRFSNLFLFREYSHDIFLPFENVSS